MNYWTRNALKYPSETDTCLSQTAMKILEKVEANNERSEAIYEIFNRVWREVMSQRLKCLYEKIMEEIIHSFTYHTTMNTLSRSIYKENQRKYPSTQKSGNLAVYDWIRWSYRKSSNEEFMDSIADLENAMQEENLLCMKIHKLLDLFVQVQENIEEKEEEII
jgi:hypothetical protein